jgi:hypothetical protein
MKYTGRMKISSPPVATPGRPYTELFALLEQARHPALGFGPPETVSGPKEYSLYEFTITKYFLGP